MIDDILELFRDSGLLKTDGEFNTLGEHFGDDLFQVCSENAIPSAKQIAEVLAQYLTLPAPAEAAGTVGYNMNFNFSAADLMVVTDFDIDRMADRAKRFLYRLADDTEDDNNDES